MNRKLFARITIIISFSLFVLLCLPTVYADPQPTPNLSEGGVNYYLSAPDTLEVDLSLYGQQHITIKDNETVTIQWENEMPQSQLEQFNETITHVEEIIITTPVPAITPLPGFTWPPSSPQVIQKSVSFNRQVFVNTLNTLTMTYSGQAFVQGNPFLTGTLTRQVTAAERIVSSEVVPMTYQYGLTEEIVQEISSGNYSSITGENTMPISFPYVSGEIISRTSPPTIPPIPSRLDEIYAQLTVYEEYAQNISLSPEFVIEIIEEIVPEAALPASTPEIETYAEYTEYAEDLIAEGEELLEEYEETSPDTLEVVAGAVSSALAAGTLGSVAASAAGQTAGFAGTAASASSAIAHVANTAIPAAGTSQILIFLKDLLTGLRDMFVDEGRAHASGKVSENLKGQ